MSHRVAPDSTSQTALVIHPDAAFGGARRHPDERLEEAVRLAEALDLEVVRARIMTLRRAAPSTRLGAGQVQEIAESCALFGCDVVVVDDALTAVQQRNLERAWGAKVLDRTGLVLEIFARRARSGEGRLQVELARLEYERSRLVRTWTHLERQRGGFGFLGGPGETQIEADRRLLNERIVKLKADLGTVKRTRELQRRGRRRTPFPIVALVGYTNAGKSSIFNSLTAAGVVAQDMLFATLDPTFRKIGLPGGRDAIISDTVGFVSDLPHELVEAFRATLDEVREADLILHVRDIASPSSESQRADVLKVLAQIDAGEGSGKAIVEVWNKSDLVSPEEVGELQALSLRRGAAMVSARTGQGLEGLIEIINSRLNDHPEMALTLRIDDGEGLAWLYRHGRVIAREDGGDRVRVRARLDMKALNRFVQIRPDALMASP